MSEGEREIYMQMHAEDDDLSSGYTTISSNQEGPVEGNRPAKKTLGHRDPASHQHHHHHGKKNQTEASKEETKGDQGKEGKVSTKKASLG